MRPTDLGKRLSEFWDRASRSPRGLLATVLVVNFGLTVWTALVTLRNFPNSGDEYSYCLSAQMIAEGHLSVPSPEPREFFEFVHVLNDGKFYSKYPPGWPLVLSLGYLAHLPWIVNPILELLTLWLLHRTCREFISLETANLAVLAAVANPFLILNSASYFSHASCLFFVVAFVYGYFRSLSPDSTPASALAAGAAAGGALLTRPFTAMALLAPVAVHVAFELRRAGRARLLGRLAVMAFSFGAAAGFLLWYDHALTGDAFLQPFAKYERADRPSLGALWEHPWDRIRDQGIYRLLELGYWVPVSLPCLALAAIVTLPACEGRRALLLSMFVSLLVAYIFYPRGYHNRYGPRYLYEGSFAILVLIGSVGCVLGRWGGIMMVMTILLNLTTLCEVSRHHRRQVDGRMELYDLVRSKALTHDIVFVRDASGGMPVCDLTRNGIHFDAPVLYVWYREGKNQELLRRYPDRKAWCWQYEKVSGVCVLVPYGAVAPGN